MIDSLNRKSNENYLNNNNNNNSNSTVDHHKNSFYPKMNFRSSVMTAMSTLSNRAPDIESTKLDTDANKNSKYVDNLTNQTDQCSMKNSDFHSINSFGPTDAMTNPNQSSSNNCSFNPTQISGNGPQQRPPFQQHPQQQQQQQNQPLPLPPPTTTATTSSTLTYSSNSNTTQIQTLNSQVSQEMQSQQQPILGTKVIRHKRSQFFFLSFAFFVLY